MIFTVLVTGPVYGTENACSAFLFSSSVIYSQHTLLSVFFYCDGVLNANEFVESASNEYNLVKKWEYLYRVHHVKLYVCISAALRRGIIKQEFKKENYVNKNNVSSCFILTSLSQFSDQVMMSDRVIKF